MVSILVAGAGSIGTVLGMYLSKDHDVTMLRRNAITSTIQMVGIDHWSTAVPVVTIDQLSSHEPFNYVFITVQMQQTKHLCQQLQNTGIINSSTKVVSLQNGMDAPAIIQTFFAEVPLVAGTVWWSASLLEPTKVLYHRKADTVLGIPTNSKTTPNQLKELIFLLSPYFEVKPTIDLTKEMRKKLLLNVVSPPLALIKQPYPQGLKEESTRKLVHALFDEALETAEILDWDIDTKNDSRLSNFHSILISGDIPEGNSSHEYTHKVSTQLGIEKYGGKGSNIHALLDWLQLSGSLLAYEVIQLVEQQPQNYSAIDTVVFDAILGSTTHARCSQENMT